MTRKMWVKGTFVLLKILLIIQLFSVDQATGIYSESQRPIFVRKTNNLDKASLIPQFYKYLKGYYQKKGLNDLAAQNAARAFPGRKRNIRLGSVDRVQHLSLNNPKQYVPGKIQPKAGQSAGQYTFAQSRDYLRKLRRLADLLKARVAARARQQQSKQQQQPQPQPQPQPQRVPIPQPPAQPSYQTPPQQNGYRPPPIQNRPPPQPAAPQPQRPPPQPQQTYIVPQQPRQQTFNQVAPKVQMPQLQSVIPKQAQASPAISYQSLGLPQSGAYRRIPQPRVTAAPSSAKPSIKTESLVKLLKASYSSLLPLLLNQAKMTSYGVQTIPLYGSNPYRVFGPMTYGPLPKPRSSQMKLSYSPQSFSATPTHPFSSGGYNSYNSGYGTGTVQVQSSTGSSGHGSSSAGSSYGGNVNSGYELSADVACGPISGAFCHGREAGHYSHPASGHCFVQCDHVGQGHPKGCSPGTAWKALGPEPALFNYCS